MSTNNLDATVAAAEGNEASRTNATNDTTPAELEEPNPKTDNNNNNTSPRRSWENSDRRLILKNVFKYLDNKKGLKFAQQLVQDANHSLGDKKVVLDKIRKPPGESFMVVTVMVPDMVQPLIDYVNKEENKVVNRRGGKITAKRAAPTAELEEGYGREKQTNGSDSSRKRKDAPSSESDLPLTKKAARRIQGSTQGMQQARRPVTVEQVRERITPLFNLSAEEQAQFKMKDLIKKCGIKLLAEIKSRFHALQREKNRTPQQRREARTYKWLTPQTKPNDIESQPTRRPIEIQEIVRVPSPLRNKVEFTFGYRYVYDDSVANVEINMVEEETKLAPNNVAETTSTTTMQSSETTATTSAPPPQTERKVRGIPSLGFMAAGWSGGVSKPHCCANIASEMNALVDLFEDFLKTSPLKPYDSKAHTGFWRFLTVRVSRRTRQCMLLLVHTPATGGVGDQPKDSDPLGDNTSDVVDFTQVWETEKARLVAVLQNASLPVRGDTSNGASAEHEPLRVTSLYLQEFGGLSNPPPDLAVQHVFGTLALQERLGKCTFQISPGAFFQVNTVGAEILYAKVMECLSEFANKQQHTGDNETPTRRRRILFDVCCGTGTIGLACLKERVVDEVIGIDVSEAAVQDAKKNAALNGFDDDTQTRFVASRAEFVMSKEISKAIHKSGNNDNETAPLFLAVVDPAREGLHTEVVRHLRQTEQIDRIVYVSCNPTGSLVKDAGLLCCPPTKKYGGRAFRVTSATPIDMFPLTNHCEMVMTFDRVQDCDM